MSDAWIESSTAVDAKMRRTARGMCLHSKDVEQATGVSCTWLVLHAKAAGAYSSSRHLVCCENESGPCISETSVCFFYRLETGLFFFRVPSTRLIEQFILCAVPLYIFFSKPRTLGTKVSRRYSKN